MNISVAASRPRLIYWLYIGMLVPVLPMYLYLLIKLLLDPSIPSKTPLDYAIHLLIGLLISPLTVAIGLWCIRRSPGNVVGAMLALWGSTIIHVIKPEDSPFVLGFSTLLSGAVWPAIYFLFCYFPDGRIYPYRFEKWIDALLTITYISGILTGLVTSFAAPTIPNPIYVPALEPAGDFVTTINSIGCAIAIFFGVGSLILRFRNGDTRTRQQIKWLLFGLLPFALLVTPYLIVEAKPELQPFPEFLSYFMQVWLMIFPLFAIGNAILRHRLYDIDIIIRRTLIYTVLSALLAILFFGGVTVAQSLFHSLTRQASDLAIVASTLTLATLFTPLRRRVQSAIDQRFYRRKYDAEKTLAQFSQTLRNETNLDALKTSMMEVVTETMQPNRIALWVREPTPIATMKEQS